MKQEYKKLSNLTQEILLVPIEIQVQGSNLSFVTEMPIYMYILN